MGPGPYSLTVSLQKEAIPPLAQTRVYETWLDRRGNPLRSSWPSLVFINWLSQISHDLISARGTPGNVKLLLPPRQSRGVSLFG